MGDRKKAKICGAKRKHGRGVCQATALYPNGRCRVHGGPTPIGPANPNWKTGLTSKWGVLPDSLAEHYARAAGQTDGALMALTNELALIDARVAELLGALGQTGSSKLWAAAIAKFTEFKVAGAKKGQLGSARIALQELDEILQKGAQASITWDSLVELLEQRRKLVDTESRRRKDAQETISIRQAMLLVSFVAKAVRDHVEDKAAQARIFMQLQKVLRGSPEASTVVEGSVVQEPRAEQPT